MVPCFPLLGLTPSGLFMGLGSTIIYTSELTLYSTIHNQNEQVQYVYHCCLCLIFDQTTMAREQKYLLNFVLKVSFSGLELRVARSYGDLIVWSGTCMAF